MSKFLYSPLTKEHDRQAFSCGINELDDYLKRHARQDARRGVAAVFVMTPDDNPTCIAGYYTLSAAAVQLSELPDKIAKKLPRYPGVPSILIGRLARDVKFPGTGKFLLMDALTRACAHSETIAAALIVVDAKNESARKFYNQFGFQELPSHEKRMFLPVKTCKQLIDA